MHQAEWIAYVVPIPKKDGKVRVCVDFRDLNKACLKDNFPTNSALISFMDGF